MSLTPFRTPAPVPAARALLVRRRIATYFLGGVDAVPGLIGVLAGDHLVHDLSVDIRDGVTESSMVCSVLVPADEIALLLGCLRELSSVVSAELL